MTSFLCHKGMQLNVDGHMHGMEINVFYLAHDLDNAVCVVAELL